MILSKTNRSIESITHASRLGLYLLLLVFTIIYQVRNPNFIHYNFLFSIYSVLIFSFGVNLIITVWGERRPQIIQSTLKYFLILDALLVSGLLYLAGLQSSLYLFFYLYLIFITAISFQVSGAIKMASFCSLLFSGVLFFDRHVTANTKIFLFLINNASFFVVAYMGGLLSQRVEVLGEEVLTKEKSIKELKSVNSLIVENIKSGLVALDESHQIVQLNQEAQTLFPQLREGEKIESVLLELREAFLKESPTHIQEVSREIQGEKYFYEILVSKIQVEGEFKGSIVLIQDITQRKLQEEQSKTQEKLAAVGQLAAGIAHEIRNPLASMSGSIQLLASSFESLDNEQKKLIAITLKETDRLNLLISEFLEFVRPKIPMEDRVDLAKLIQDCVEMLKLNTQIKLPQFQLNLQPGVVIQGNHDKLKQVVLNILINGSHAMEKTEGAEFQIRLQQGERIEMIFMDNGVGMDEKTRKRLFEPFFTTKSKGTGLGLALVHKVLEQHGAQVQVSSDLGKGTQFKISF